MIIIELAYSFHLVSDKNKKNSSKASAKSNVSGTTSKSNNAMQNAGGLTKVDNHNYVKYDNKQEDKDKIKKYINQVDKTNDEYKNIQTLSITPNNVDNHIQENQKAI